ncbi:YkgJ family cysteine cluster protein [Rhodoblastus sp.]|uniref:YkgJ family cysteine cluster protein n=1 Tax=Rhodoblastus sp. TaxID=1962975 RepID=UPI003F9C9500
MSNFPGDDELTQNAVDADREYREEEERRRQAETDLDVPIVSAIRGAADSPVVPIRLTGSNSFCFNCHPGVSCFNECCHDTDITLTPYDLIRIGRAAGVTSGEAGRMFGTEAVHEASGMPILKLKRVDTGDERRPCVFLDPEKGCSIYADRPAACRYYPLGLASVKMKGHDAPEDFYFLVKEPHCKGHEENREQTVAEFRADQGVEIYDERNRSWIHILMKLASWKTLGGPQGKEVDERTKKMFFMATTDLDAFRRFVFGTSFLQRYAIDPEMHATLEKDDETLLLLAFDWMRAILFAEETLPLREEVLQESIAKARAGLGGT